MMNEEGEEPKSKIVNQYSKFDIQKKGIKEDIVLPPSSRFASEPPKRWRQ